ncbi:tRNA (adenosine(37)-N6)-threonylcarbamoyltransferase complex dimerization subunit type 1 TsaB [Canibacter oris]|uniref:tRNA threonylcarbamoyl adenosine modification protein YeaZ n=1 Tax=Canibacter oris TaxID=1365628 RepID=A0A840DHN1_9MICO|nr:tRNA (adenosine(37)-N6)-threonylcarbamoyltransferase complex dimerization subunit type 1 TsaB [Canibacter oris]MBB4071223.1 tRNA threonylcarbamoyl adenosine modification protein YeaZ [Canibacter oris]
MTATSQSATAASARFTVTALDLVAADPAARLLAIDTSGGTTVAVSTGAVAWQARSADPLAHAEVIGEMIAACLTAAGVRAQEITGVVMGTGPGSFTGLRVGMAAAQGFAAVRGVPLLPLVSHEAVALRAARGSCAVAGVGAAVTAAAATAEASVLQVRIVQDARRREFFVSSYEIAADWAVTATLPRLVSSPEVVPQADFVTVATDITEPEVWAGDLLQLAALRVAQGLPFAAAEPVYLRDPDVRQPAGTQFTGAPVGTSAGAFVGTQPAAEQPAGVKTAAEQPVGSQPTGIQSPGTQR